MEVNSIEISGKQQNLLLKNCLYAIYSLGSVSILTLILDKYNVI